MGWKPLALLGAGMLVTMPADGASLNTNMSVPVRPHVNLNAPLHIEVKPRVPYSIDLGHTCQTDERTKGRKLMRRRCPEQR